VASNLRTELPSYIFIS